MHNGEPGGRPPEPKLDLKEILRQEVERLRALNVTGQWSEATTAFATLEADTSPERIDLCLEAALSHRMLSGPHYNEAERLFRTAGSLAHSGNDSEREVHATVGLGDLYRSGAKKNPDYHADLGRAGKLAEARRYEAHAQTLLEQLPSASLAKLKAFCEFGLLDVEEGKYSDALADYTQAQSAAEALLAAQPHDLVAQNQLMRVYTLTGEGHGRLNNWTEAHAWHQKSYEGYTQMQDRRGMALGMQGMALALENNNDTSGAIQAWERVTQIATGGKETDQYMLDKAQQALERLRG